MSETESETPHGKPTLLFSWMAPRRIFIEHDSKWFIGLVVVVAVIAVLMFLVSEITLALFFLAFGFAIFALNYVRPDLAEYQLFSNGFKVGGKLYEWKDLESFWIAPKSGHLVLFVKTKLLVPDRLEVIVENSDKTAIEDVLNEKLSYVEGLSSDFMEFIDGLITGVSFRLPTKMELGSIFRRSPRVRLPAQAKDSEPEKK